MRSALLTATFALAALAGCGGEKTFDAEGFTDALNEEGAGLVLGGTLPNQQESVDVYGIALEDGGGGSITVTENVAAGEAEYDRCEAAPTLLCYRASNVVLILEDGLSPESRASLEAALRGVATE